MKITIKEKNVYGNLLLYPVCETAKTLLLLTRNATFSLADISVIQMLGYEVEIQKIP
jgi:hypothetical protein